MDADSQDRERDHLASRREKRWSMYSQRLEEIVAELMRPISDIRHSFDMDLSALLEEYLTEAGLHALAGGVEPAVPNFMELALLLQHLARLYGRKVDFLYLAVLVICDSLRNNTQQASGSSASVEEEPPRSDAPGTPGAPGAAHATPGPGRRRRRASGAAAAEFEELELEPWAGANANARGEGSRPPPTLPRMFMELEPRVLPHSAPQLYDYAGEPFGLPADYYVAWRLQDGFLVDELEAQRALPARRRVSLNELQAAIDAGGGPAGASTPLPHDPALPPPPPPSPPPSPLPSPLDLTIISRTDRKRRNDLSVDELLDDCFTTYIDADVRHKLLRRQEFSVSGEWIERVVRQRTASIVQQRRGHVVSRCASDSGFRGFEVSDADVGGFPGWSRAEAEAAQEWARAFVGSTTRIEPESEDDGFFERSSLGDFDETPPPHSVCAPLLEPPCLSWQERVAARATAQEARGGVDVNALALTLMDACSPATTAPAPATTAPAPAPVPFTSVLRSAADKPEDVSRLLLVTLFLANAGNVEIVQGAPLAPDAFSVRLLSRDRRLYAAAAAADQPFLR